MRNRTTQCHVYTLSYLQNEIVKLAIQQHSVLFLVELVQSKRPFLTCFTVLNSQFLLLFPHTQAGKSLWPIAAEDWSSTHYTPPHEHTDRFLMILRLTVCCNKNVKYNEMVKSKGWGGNSQKRPLWASDHVIWVNFYIKWRIGCENTCSDLFTQETVLFSCTYWFMPYHNV